MFWLGPPAPKVPVSDKESKNTISILMLATSYFEKGGAMLKIEIEMDGPEFFNQPSHNMIMPVPGCFADNAVSCKYNVA